MSTSSEKNEPLKQLELPLGPKHRSPPEPKILVKLSDSDLTYRQLCIDQGKALPEPFLKETRAQRLGTTVQCLDNMLNYELARELADEQICMGRDDWATVTCTRIDWEAINQRAAYKAQELSLEFEAFRRQRKELQHASKKAKAI